MRSEEEGRGDVCAAKEPTTCKIRTKTLSIVHFFNSPTPGVDNETMFRGMFKKMYLFGVNDVSRKWASSQKRHRQMSRDEQLANSEKVLGT